MKWQDYVLAAGSIWFALSLIPTIRSKTHKPELSTSVMTAFCLSVFVVVDLTLDLKLAAVASLVTAAMWWVLAWQVHGDADKVGVSV